MSYTRIVELDIRVNSSYNDFHVAHNGSSPDNNCGSGGDGMLSDCLDDIVSFHNAHSDHDPIIIYLELKDDFASTNGHSALDLDALLIQKLGINNIYKPSDFSGGYSDLRLVAGWNNWPSFEDLLGKFLVVINGEAVKCNNYNSTQQPDPVCFTMAGTYVPTTDSYDLMTTPYFGYTNKIVFYNFQLQDGIWPGHFGYQADWDDWPTLTTAPEWVSGKGYFSRVWSLNNTWGPGNYNEADFNSVVPNKINAIAVANIDESRSYDENGILDQCEVDNPVLTNNIIFSTFNTVTQYGKYSITTDNLIVEPGTHYRLISGGPVYVSPATVFKPGSNVEILEYQNLSSSLKRNVRILTQAEIDEIMKEVITELYNYQPIEELKDNEIHVYPSPARNYVNLVFNNNTGEEVLVNVYDIRGALVKTQSFTTYTKGQQKISLQISELPRGMYIFKLFVDQANYSGKFIKQD